MGQITLNWDDFSNGVTYNVYRTTTPVSNINNLPTPLVTGLTDKTYVDTTVVEGTYYYRIGTVIGNTVVYSDEVQNTIVVFAAPYNLAGSYISSKVELSWDSDNNQEYFDVYRDNVLIATGITAKTYSDSGVTAGMNYSYKVASVAMGTSKYSSTITVNTTLADPYWSSVDYLIMPYSGVIVDKSTHNRTITNSNVTIVNDEMYFNGTNAGLTFTAAALSALDHTFEFFLNIPLTVGSASLEMIWRLGTTGDFLSYTTTSDTLSLTLQGVGTLSLGTVTRGTRQHFCFERSGTTVYGFRNGVLTGSIAAHSTTITAINVGIQGTQFPLKGTISQMRMTLGVARYATTGFTPPTSFPVVV